MYRICRYDENLIENRIKVEFMRLGAAMDKEFEELKNKCDELIKKNEKLERENFGMKVTITNLRKQLDKFYRYYS